VTDNHDTSADSTRQQILRAACHQFAHRSYGQVSLDDILADARVTKGAMYFHFRSKHALAMAIIELQSQVTRSAANELLARKLSGLESLVDISYLIALQDVSQDLSRAGLHLLESIGRTDGLRANLLRDWIKAFALVVQRAIADGDVIDKCDPVEVSQMLVSLYAGIRQIGNLDDPDEYFDDLEKSWLLALPGFAAPERVGYLTKFIKRRTALAKTNAKAAACAVTVNPA
jgi:TetR/AcrR family transcriptional regulator, transcriptional repressor for nem operon